MKTARILNKFIGAALVAGTIFASQTTAWADPKLTNLVTTLLSPSPILAGTTGTYQVVVTKGTGAFNFFAIMSVTNPVPAGVTVTFNPGSFDYNTGPDLLKTGQMLVALSPSFVSTNFNICARAHNEGSPGDFTGNCGTSVSTVSTNPPSCSVSGPSTSCPNTAGLTFTDTTDAVTPKFNWSVTGNGSIVGPATNVSVSVTSGAAGSLTAICTVTDLANGKSNTCSKVVSVVDTNAPSITTCATNQIGFANASCQASVPSFTNGVVASDNCSAVSITQSPTIGTLVGFGTNTVTISAADLNGNTNTCTASFIVRDTTAPSITTCATNQFGTANASCQAAVPNFTNSVVASDNCSAVSITQSPTIGTLVALGTNTVTISAFDTNGNTNTCTASFIVRDTTAPSITTCATNQFGTANGSCQAAVPNFTAGVVASDNCTSTTLAQSPALSSLVGVGTNTVTISAFDTNGNTNTCTASFIVIDTTPPTLSCPANVITNLTLNTCIISNVVLGVPSATNDNCGVASVSNNAPAGFSAGVNNVVWTVTDIHGNTASCTQTVTIVDITPPDITQGPTNQTGNAGLSCTAVVPSFTNGVTATTNCGKTFTVSQNPLAGASAALGTNTVTVFVVDNAGNTNSSTASFIVEDTTVPVVTTCPSNQTGEATSGGEAAVPNFTGGVVGSDNCSSINVTQLPTAGTFVGLGTNSVTVTVSDSSGNSTNCTVSFVVADTTPPTITSCAGNQQAEAVSGGQAAVPDFTAGVTASDNGGTPTITQSPLSGTLVGVGPHAVTITVADNSGNSTNCTATFTVVDTTSPTISACATNLMADSGVGCSVAVPDFTGNVTASDNGTLTITQSPTAGTFVGAGLHTVTITVADQSSNSTNCTASFTVEDTTPPMITCLADRTIHALPGETNAVANFPLPSTSDNCGVAAVVCDPASGSVLPLGVNTISCTVTDNAGLTASCSFTITVLPVNAPPVANNDAYSTDAGVVLTVAAPGVLANDSDTEGDPITAILINPGPAHGLVVLNADGSFTYTPASGFVGTDTFKYRANDGVDNSNLGFVTITVNAVNRAPVVLADSFTTDTNTVLNVAAPGVLANDYDEDGDPITAVQATSPTHGMVTFNADGSFTYTPDTGFVGFDSFSYAGTDGMTTSAPVAIVIGVGLVDSAPDAVTDDYTTDEDVPLIVSEPGVLGNDSDIDSDSLTAILVSGPAHGNVVLNPDGSFVYTPAPDYNGADSFTYRANDGIVNSSVALVTLTVTPVNDAPVAGSVVYGTDQDTELNVPAPGVLGSVLDVDGDTLTAIVVSGPSDGMLVMNPDGSFTYTPDMGFTGVDSFTYAAVDGTTTSTPATVTIYVGFANHVPFANNDSYGTDEDTTLNVAAPGLLINDTDADDDVLTPVLVDSPSHGMVTINADGSFAYTPDQDFNGNDMFTYKVNDGTVDSGIARVFITINPVNDAPVVQSSTPNVDEDMPLVVPAPGALTGAFDVDGDPFTAILITNVTNGTLNFNADGSYDYTPDANFNGTDCFVFAATDGVSTSDFATVCITLNSVNDAPVVQSSTPDVDEDMPLVVPAPGALTGAFDVDGDPFTAILITNVTNGTLNFNADGSYDYTPDADFNGTDCFVFAATDGVSTSDFATVCITVNAVNDAPVVQSSTPDVDEDMPLIVAAPGALAGAFDVDGDPITAILIIDVSNGTLNFNPDGSYDYTPDADFNGTDCFTFAATDGVSTSDFATVCITVNSVNDAPVADDDSYTIDANMTLNVGGPGVLGNDSDVDGDSLTAALVSDVAHGSLTLNADGSFSYTPANNYSGPDSFTYMANDGALDSNIATVDIDVTGGHTAPVANNDGYDTDEDMTLDVSAPGVLANDTDDDGDPLTAVLVSNASHGSVTLNADGSFSYSPNANFAGSDSFTYKANDGEFDSEDATVTITVAPINDAPVAANDSYSVAEDDVLEVSAPGVLGNDTDVDSISLTAMLVTGPTHGELTLNSDGSFTYTPDNNFSGSDSFTYKANDGSLDSNSATVTITVNAIGGAGDIDLLAGRVWFHQNRSASNRDWLRIRGRINPRGANENLAGATMLFNVNGLDLSAPVTLDAAGRAEVVVGGKKIKASLNSANGKYSFTITGADISEVLDLSNTTGSGLTVLNVSLVVSNANLDIPVIAGDFETPYRTRAGKYSNGRFNFKRHRILTGVFNSNKTIAKLGKHGGYIVNFKGAMENQNDASIVGTGAVQIHLDNRVLTVPVGAVNAPGVKLYLPVQVTHTFRLRTEELMDTEIPLPGPGAPTSYRLPLMLLIPSGNVTNVFETIIELKRPDGASKKWSR